MTSFYIVLYHIMTCNHTDCPSRCQGFPQNLSFFAWQQDRPLESFPATAPSGRPRRWQEAQRHCRDARSWFTHGDYDFQEFETRSTLSVDPEFISEFWKAPHLPTLTSHLEPVATSEAYENSATAGWRCALSDSRSLGMTPLAWAKVAGAERPDCDGERAWYTSHSYPRSQGAWRGIPCNRHKACPILPSMPSPQVTSYVSRVAAGPS
jgi:hypothetical protein